METSFPPILNSTFYLAKDAFDLVYTYGPRSYHIATILGCYYFYGNIGREMEPLLHDMKDGGDLLLELRQSIRRARTAKTWFYIGLGLNAAFFFATVFALPQFVTRNCNSLCPAHDLVSSRLGVSGGLANWPVSQPSGTAAVIHTPSQVDITPQSTEVAVRNPIGTAMNTYDSELVRRVVNGQKIAQASFLTLNLGVSWFGMTTSCLQFGDPGSTVQCVWGAISTLYTAGVAWNSRKDIRETLTGVYGDIVAVVSTQAGIPTTKHKRDDHAVLIDAYSNLLGSPVKHLGYHEHHHHQHGANSKSTAVNSTMHPVYGFSINDTDYHIAYLGEHTRKGSHNFRMGYGSGVPVQSNNTKRSNNYENQYFGSGGLDWVWFEDPTLIDYSNIDFDVNSVYTGLYDQVSCWMSQHMQDTGMWFQIYDEDRGGTLVSGAASGFSVLVPSVIDQMQSPKGGLKQDGRCGATH